MDAIEVLAIDFDDFFSNLFFLFESGSSLVLSGFYLVCPGTFL